METKQENKQWQLIHNDNGEWISEEYVVFVSKLEAVVLQIEAVKQKKPLAIQHGSEGRMWCYKHEVEAIDLTEQKTKIKPRTLKIKKMYGKRNI